MYLIIQDNQILGDAETREEALRMAADCTENGEVQIAHVLQELASTYEPITDWATYNGVKAGRDFPHSLRG